MRIGIDLGGTKIEAALLGPTGEKIAGRRVATPRQDYDGTIAAIVALARDMQTTAGVRASVGVAIPGTTIGRPRTVADSGNPTV